MAKEPEILEGTIEALNEKGLKVAGEWRNWSSLEHLASHTAALKALNPRKGQRVRIAFTTSNGRHYLEDLQILDTPAQPASSGAPTGGGYRGLSPEEAARVTYLSAFSSAATFLAGRERFTPADLFVVAEAGFERAMGTLDAGKAQERMLELARLRQQPAPVQAAAGGAR